MKVATLTRLAVGALLLSGSGHTLRAQSFSISWHKIAGGGDASGGGGWSLTGTIGQPDAGGPLSGGGFSLIGGFMTPTPSGSAPPGSGTNNLVTNGDFSLGNTNFGSDYSYAPYNYSNYTDTPQVMAGDYTVGPYVPPSYSDWAPFNTVSGGSSQMLIVNGAGSAGQSVWNQTIGVTPKTTYAISFYLAEVSNPGSLADIAVNLGGTQIGDAVAPSLIDTWQQYAFTWNSGSRTNILMSLIDLNTDETYNDFAIANIALVALNGTSPRPDVVWTNTAGGNWNSPANWSPNQAPSLTNTASIAAPGNYTVTNDVGALAVANLIVGGGGSGVQSLLLNGGSLHGAFTVTSGGVLATLGYNPAQLAVGGVLTVDSGGALNLGAGLEMFGPCTNNGTINLTNGYLYLRNNGQNSGALGALVNAAGGTIGLWGAGGIEGSGGQDYLLNQGALTKAFGSGSAVSVQVDSLENQGVISVQTGALSLSRVTLAPSGSLSVGLNSASDYGQISISGNAALAGTLSARLNNGFVPAPNESFTVLAYGSYSGALTHFNLPAAVTWQESYGSATLTLTAGPASQTNLVLPVYQVTQAGATFAQATSLANALDLPMSGLLWTNGLVSFLDPTNYLFIPTIPVTDAMVISNLLARTKNPDPAKPISFRAIDFASLSNFSLLDTNVALATAAQALGTSGLGPQFGTPVIAHTLLTAFCTNADQTVSSARQYLDTQVDYQFTEPGGHPIVGPGAQAQFNYGANGKLSSLYYATRQMTTGPLISIISATEATNRIARLLPANAQIDLELVYYSPAFAPTLPCPGCAAAWNPTNIIPWYLFSGAVTVTNPAGGLSRTETTALQMIPATDDTNFVPQLSLSALAAGGTQVVAQAVASGGRPPYIYLWTGSNPTVATNTGPTLTYAPRIRVAPPPLRVSYSHATASIRWPYPSTGFVLESTPDLGTLHWTEVSNTVETNTGVNVVSLSASNHGFFRLRLANESLPVSETVGVTVMDANGVLVRANQVLAVLARPLPPNRGDPPVTYGTEDPYNAGGWDHDDAVWRAAMSQFSGGSEAFCWQQYNSWPGDFANGLPLGTLQSTSPNGLPGPNLPIDGDFAGVNSANIVLYLGHGNSDLITFTWPNFAPLDGSPAYCLSLNTPADTMWMTYADNANNWSLVPQDILGWGNMGPNDYLNWLCLEACYVLQDPDADGVGAWSRWHGAFNGLHMMLGYDTESWYGLGIPGIFATRMCARGILGLFPQTIVQAWFGAASSVLFVTGHWNLSAAAMGPVGPGGVTDQLDYFPGIGSMGPSIPQDQFWGYWHLKTVTP